MGIIYKKTFLNMKKFTIILASIATAISMAGQPSTSGLSEQEKHPQQEPCPRHAVVGLSSIYMRIAPDYESALETQELMGTVVEVTGEKGYWREIVSPQPYRAWCTEKGIVEMRPEAVESYLEAPKCMFTELYGHVYEQPSYKSQSICDLVGGDIIRKAGNGRRKARSKGWTKIILPSGIEGWVKSNTIKPHNDFRSIAKGEGNADSISDREMEEIIATAFRLKGVPYLWGGMTPKGVDCSGLVRWSCLMNGILLPRNASQMVHCGDEVPLTLPQNGNAAGLENLQRGDLVFFGTPATDEKPQRVTHVGIYIGNDHIIHSSHLVRVNSLIPGAEDYYENSHRLIAARRL